MFKRMRALYLILENVWFLEYCSTVSIGWTKERFLACSWLTQHPPRRANKAGWHWVWGRPPPPRKGEVHCCPVRESCAAWKCMRPSWARTRKARHSRFAQCCWDTRVSTKKECSYYCCCLDNDGVALAFPKLPRVAGELQVTCCRVGLLID